jgi:hypothetical protein
MRRPEALSISKINNRKSSINLGWSATRNLTAFALWNWSFLRAWVFGYFVIPPMSNSLEIRSWGRQGLEALRVEAEGFGGCFDRAFGELEDVEGGAEHAGVGEGAELADEAGGVG